MTVAQMPSEATRACGAQGSGSVCKTRDTGRRGEPQTSRHPDNGDPGAGRHKWEQEGLAFKPEGFLLTFLLCL